MNPKALHEKLRQGQVSECGAELCTCREVTYVPSRKKTLFQSFRCLSYRISKGWVVVKIMVPFGVPIMMIFRVITQKGTTILTTTQLHSLGAT